MRNRLEQKWEIYCTIAAVVTHLILFGVNQGRIRLQDAAPNTDPYIAAFFGLIPMSLIVTLFLVGIPSRILMNLMVKDRRRKCWFETLVLVLTFVALGLAFYSIYFRM